MDILTDTDLHDRYDEHLDELHGEFMDMQASRILRETDPIAYRTGFSDYIDAECKAGNLFETPSEDYTDTEFCTLRIMADGALLEPDTYHDADDAYEIFDAAWSRPWTSGTTVQVISADGSVEVEDTVR